MRSLLGPYNKKKHMIYPGNPGASPPVPQPGDVCLGLRNLLDPEQIISSCIKTSGWVGKGGGASSSDTKGNRSTSQQANRPTGQQVNNMLRGLGELVCLAVIWNAFKTNFFQSSNGSLPVSMLLNVFSPIAHTFS